MPTIPTDDRFGDQWHLRNTAIGQYDLNVVDVWDDYTGKGINIFVLDSGVDYTNPDLAPNYNAARSRDFGDGDSDPAPTGDKDNHGTAVAGIISAAANNGGVVGIAYGSTLVSCRVGDGFFLWTAVTAALNYGTRNGADVMNLSLGRAYNFADYSNDTTAMMKAVDRTVEDGRDSLGVIVVKSAGNERDDGIPTDVNAQVTGNNTHMIITAAVNRDGSVSSYSTPGASILISALGSPIPGQVVTTDRMGAAGYSSDGIATDFNGTSAAAPMISGVVALLLDANPNLGWRDVQTILAYSARHVGTEVGAMSLSGFEQAFWAFNGADDWNGGGLHFSTDYGYGLVDAEAAVRLAESWTAKSTSRSEERASATFLDVRNARTIADGDMDGSVFQGKITKDIDVERVAVNLEFTAEEMQDFELYLTGPDGLKHRLISDVRQGDEEDYFFVDYGERGYTFTSQEFRGESSKGIWQVQIVDDSAGWVTTVSEVKIQIFGTKASANDTYIYTNEFSDFFGSHSGNLADSNGGRDLLNASAVSGGITVNLATMTGTIDGMVMSAISGIENVYGGDGIDTITGSNSDNIIAGGRGGDMLRGGTGDDIYRYFNVHDSFGSNQDFVDDFGKGDTLDLRSIDANINTARNDKFKFIGETDMTGVAGQLHFLRSGMITFVAADIDGDGIADLLLNIEGSHKFVKGDFAL